MDAKENGSIHPSQLSNNGDTASGDDAKLPKVHLKSYSGDVLLFQEFWECYRSAVHDNGHLDKVTKFNYLRSLLQGTAAATISGLSLSEENYEEAITLLKSRYGNKQVLISAHIDKLLTLLLLVMFKIYEKFTTVSKLTSVA